MGKLCIVALFLVAACKNKEQAKPTPAAEPKQTAQVAPRPELPAPPDEPKPAPTPTPAIVKPAGGFTTAVEYETKAFELVDKLSSIFEAAGTNCEKLADNLELFVHDHKPMFDNTRAFETANPDAEKALEGKMAEKSKRFMARVQASMQACQKHERVKAALAKLPD